MQPRKEEFPVKKLLTRSLALMLCLAALSIPFSAFAEETEDPNATELLKTYTKLDLTPYLGKTVLVNFFTEWCTYCMQEMPDLKAAAEMYDPDTFQLVFVHPWDGEDASNTESVKAKFGMEDMVFVEDEDGAIASLVGLPGYPTSLFIDAEGTLVGAAPFMLTLDQLTYQLDQMGAQRKADVE